MQGLLQGAVMISRRSLAKSTLALPFVYAPFRSGLARALYADDDCGVASGHPTATSVVLWTRVPEAGRGGQERVAVRYEVATNLDFAPRSLVVGGVVETDAD